MAPKTELIFNGIIYQLTTDGGIDYAIIIGTDGTNDSRTELIIPTTVTHDDGESHEHTVNEIANNALKSLTALTVVDFQGASITIGNNAFAPSGTGTGTLYLADTNLASEFTSSGLSGWTVVDGEVCLTKTCNILTPNGYVNVSELKEGDLVLTTENKILPIQKLYKRKHYINKKNCPVLIKKNMFGNNLPFKDTYISDKHGYKVNGVWQVDILDKKLEKNWSNNYVIYYNLKIGDVFKDYLMVNGIEMESWDGKYPGEGCDFSWIKVKDGFKRVKR